MLATCLRMRLHRSPIRYAAEFTESVHLLVQDYELAMKRVRSLLELNFEDEAEKKATPSHDVMWAVFEAFSK